MTAITHEDVIQYFIEKCEASDIDFSDALHAKQRIQLICECWKEVYAHFSIFSPEEGDSQFIQDVLWMIDKHDLNMYSHVVSAMEFTPRFAAVLGNLLYQDAQYENMQIQLLNRVIDGNPEFAARVLIDHFDVYFAREIYCDRYAPESLDIAFIVDKLKKVEHHNCGSLFSFYKRHPYAAQHIDELYREAPKLRDKVVKFKIELGHEYTREDFEAFDLRDCEFDWIEKHVYDANVRDAFMKDYFCCSRFSRPLGEFTSVISNNLKHFDNPKCRKALKEFYALYLAKGACGREYHPRVCPSGSGWVRRQPKDLWLEQLHNCIVALDRKSNFTAGLIAEYARYVSGESDFSRDDYVNHLTNQLK